MSLFFATKKIEILKNLKGNDWKQYVTICTLFYFLSKVDVLNILDLFLSYNLQIYKSRLVFQYK